MDTNHAGVAPQSETMPRPLQVGTIRRLATRQFPSRRPGIHQWPAMNDFIEWPAIWLTDRREGAVGGIPESEKVGHDVVVGDTQDRAGRVLFVECRMAGADAEGGGLDHHGHRGLAQVVLIEKLRRSSGGTGATSAIAAGADAIWRALPHSGQLLQPIRIGDKHEIPGLRFDADGDRHPASAIRCKSLSGNGSGR